MVVAHDAVSSSLTEFREAAQGNPYSWLHTPSGTPRGAVVCLYSWTEMGATADAAVEAQIVSVLYGGRLMTKVPTSGFARSTSAEQSAVWMYDLIDGVPAGPQSVQVRMNANPEPVSGNFSWFWGWAATMTAATTSLQRLDSDLIGSSSTVTDPSVTLSNGATVGMAYAGLFSGSGTLANVSPAAGVTELGERITDSTAKIFAFYRLTTAASGNQPIGATVAVDDAAMTAASYGEVADTSALPTIIGRDAFMWPQR